MAVDFDSQQAKPTGALLGMAPGSGNRSFMGALANNPVLMGGGILNVFQRVFEQRTGRNPFQGIAGGGVTRDPNTNFVENMFATPSLPPPERNPFSINPQTAETWGQAGNMSQASAGNMWETMSPDFSAALTGHFEQINANNRMREEWFNTWRDQMGAVYGQWAEGIQGSMPR